MTSAGWNRFWMAVMGAVIVGGGLWGFGHKFLALVRLALQEQGGAEAAFAVAPVVNYLLASLGFLCLVGWAAAHGMFHDIEGPKYTMLDVESRLDAGSQDEQFARSILE
ncbi:MAG TPA: hypothetical protein PJ982_07360 [Lacipirellulaceae bacterium]|nr:hypothetical protein [Lacipirellulaceae bacterium]